MLEASGLMVFYENMLALNNVGIRCEENQIVGVFGANSAGKIHPAVCALRDHPRHSQKRGNGGGERVTLAGSIRWRAGNSLRKPSQGREWGIVLCPNGAEFSREHRARKPEDRGIPAGASQAGETWTSSFAMFPALKKLKNRVGGFSAVESSRCWPSAGLMRSPRSSFWMNRCWASAAHAGHAHARHAGDPG